MSHRNCQITMLSGEWGLLKVIPLTSLIWFLVFGPVKSHNNLRRGRGLWLSILCNCQLPYRRLHIRTHRLCIVFDCLALVRLGFPRVHMRRQAVVNCIILHGIASLLFCHLGSYSFIYRYLQYTIQQYTPKIDFRRGPCPLQGEMMMAQLQESTMFTTRQGSPNSAQLANATYFWPVPGKTLSKPQAKAPTKWKVPKTTVIRCN